MNIYRETAKCPVCSELPAMVGVARFVKANVPEALIPHSYASASAVAWIIYCATNYFTPLYDYLHRELIKRQFLIADETRVQVLKELGIHSCGCSRSEYTGLQQSGRPVSEVACVERFRGMGLRPVPQKRDAS